MAEIEKQQRRVSYVESSFDQATSLPILSIGTDDVYLQEVRARDGERTFPGQSLGSLEDNNITQAGFLWADTPESSVFVRKKQWRDDGWNYEIINIDDPTKQDAGKKTNNKMRSILGNIITRKLEWLNDHEQFTKTAAAIRSFLSFPENAKSIQAYYDVGSDTERANLPFSVVFDKIKKLRFGDSVVPSKELVEFQKKIISDNESVIRVAVQDDFRSKSKTFSEDEFQQQLKTVSQLLIIPAGTRIYYDASNLISSFVTPDGSLAQPAKELLYNLYAPSTISDAAFTRYFQTIEDDKPVFNGVIEFANITSLSTSMSLGSDGSANLTFENPGNIMHISRDDVELALAEAQGIDPYDRALKAETGNLNQEVKLGTADLVFYRGRYYTKSVIEKLGFSYSDIDDSVKKTTSEGTDQTPSTPEKKVVSKEGDPFQYTVVKGDWLVNIAKKFNTSVSEIMSLKENEFIKGREYKSKKSGKVLLRGADLIVPGDTIFIPGKTTQETFLEIVQTKANEIVKDKGKTIPVATNDNVAKETDVLREGLYKYILNRWIIEPTDHVWIWITSPSKSIFTISYADTSRDVIEAPDSIMALRLKLEELVSKRNTKLEEYAAYRKDETTPKEILEKLQFEIDSLEAEIKTITDELRSVQEAKKAGKLSTDQATANRTDLLEDFTDDLLRDVVSETQGLSEQQFQAFEGVVTEVTETYSNGKYTLSVTCRDVFYFLELSRIMTKPSLRGTSEPKFELNNPIITTKESPGKGAWKTGALTKFDEAVFGEVKQSGVAQTINSEEEKGKKKTIQELRDQIGIFVTTKPFAKTDAANVISFLILGIPFNPELFMQNAIMDGRLFLNDVKENKDREAAQNTPQGTVVPSSKVNTDQSTTAGKIDDLNGYFNIVRKSMGLQNETLGNFKPFTSFSQTQLDAIVASNNQPNNEKVILEKEIKELSKDTIAVKILSTEKSKTGIVDLSIIGQSKQTPLESCGLKQEYTKELINGTVDGEKRRAFPSEQEWKENATKWGYKKSTAMPELTVQGRDVLSEIYKRRTSIKNLDAIPKITDQFLKGLSISDKTQLVSYLGSNLKRREDIVRNKDNNYLIISSQYSQNQSIDAFNYELNQGNWSLWQSEYENPLGTCKRAAEVINFEFFADENGNIRFEPPRYNRTLKEHLPRVFAQKGVVGDELRKKFESDALKSFVSNIDQHQKAIIELDQLQAQLLRAKTSTELTAQLLSKESSLVKQIEDLTKKNVNLENALNKSPSDISLLTEFSNWSDSIIETRQSRILGLIEQYLDIVEQNPGNEIKIENESINIVGEVRKFIKESTDAYAVQLKQLEAQLNDVQRKIIIAQQEITQVNVGTIKNQIFDKEKEIADLTNKIDQGKFAIDDDNKYATLRDLTDDGKIHRVPDSIIISSNFKESKPRFTRLDVSGEPYLVNLADAAETYYWAGGVDYDLWRSYGFIEQSVSVPYFHSGKACKSYCECLLGRQWGQIFSGTITVRGDSKYRLHDCVYVENKDMYYRIAGVSHSFTYGESYQTTLTLDFGRRPEFIIPDPWDILGKLTIEAVSKDPDISSPQTKEQLAINVEAVNKQSETAQKVMNETRDSLQTKAAKANSTGSTDSKNPTDKVNNISQTQPSIEAKNNDKAQKNKEKVTKLKTDIANLKNEKQQQQQIINSGVIQLEKEKAKTKIKNIDEQITQKEKELKTLQS